MWQAHLLSFVKNVKSKTKSQSFVYLKHKQLFGRVTSEFCKRMLICLLRDSSPRSRRYFRAGGASPGGDGKRHWPENDEVNSPGVGGEDLREGPHVDHRGQSAVQHHYRWGSRRGIQGRRRLQVQRAPVEGQQASPTRGGATHPCSPRPSRMSSWIARRLPGR